MKRWTFPRLAAVVASAAVVLAVAVGAAFGAGVDPASYSATLTSGSSVTIQKTVHTPAIPPKVDILFLADTTGSMGPAIANRQANASSILSQVRTAQPDSEFGAANYKDVNCDAVPFKVDQAITTDTTAAQNGINAWSASGGCDTPEAQVNALFQIGSGAAGFRSGSTRVVAWFGDASGHDPSNGHTLGDAI